MIKEKRILSYFIGWLIIGLCILFVGVNNVFAATYYTDRYWSMQYYDNRGSSASIVTTNWNESLQSYISNNITTAAGSYGAGVAFSSPIPLIQNHTYTLSLYFPDRNNIALSSKSVLLLGSNLDDAKNKYVNEIWTAETIQSKVLNNSIIQFVFKANYSLNYIFIPWTTTNTATQDYFFTQVIMEDLGSEGVSINDINSSLSSQTNELNNSIQNSTNEIKGEIDNMEQSIIDSNKETQDVIKDQFNKCEQGQNILNNTGTTTTSNGITYTVNEDGSITLNGTSTDFSSFVIQRNVNLEKGLYYIIPTNSNYISFVGYDGNTWPVSLNSIYNTFTLNEDKTFIQFYYQITSGQTFNNFKLYPMISKTPITSYQKYGEETCSNRLDETNDKLNDIQGAITDSSAPNTSGLENSAGWLPAGPLDSILNLPLTMLNSLTNSLGKTCAPLSLTLPYVNKNIQIPCLSAIFAQITGVNGLWTWVGTIASVLILYNYLLNLYAWVDRILTLRAEFDEAMGADLANWGRL